MLFETATVCAPLVFIVVVYLFPPKTWYTYGTILIHNIKFNYTGVLFWIDDLVNARYNKTDLPLMPGKIAIVTGGSRGIGAEIVKKLLQCDMNVIIACRTTNAGEKCILNIRKSGITSGQAKVYKLDNASLDSVRKFAEQIKENYDKIHILINNAGIMVPAIYRETEDGFEEQWAVNYLSHFLLTSLLLPLLEAGGHSGDSSRIINVTSCAHNMGIINFDCINNYFKGTYFKIAAYTQSKLAQTIFTIRLQQLLTDKLMNVQVYAVHPGVVSTDLFKDTIFGKRKWLTIAWKTPNLGALPIVYAAVNKDIERKGGIYISNCKETLVPSEALKKNIQDKLFKLSLKQVQLNGFF